MTTLRDFSATSLHGTQINLSKYAGQVVVVVNTASKCGLTSQYEGLERLYEQYRDRGLVILGFPCNQFAGQEPGDSQQIEEFCQLNYGVSFPMFAKVDVNGKNAHPLWAWLRSERAGILSQAITWNFTKFLINRQGEVVKRYAPTTPPHKLAQDIEKLLHC